MTIAIAIASAAVLLAGDIAGPDESHGGRNDVAGLCRDLAWSLLALLVIGLSLVALTIVPALLGLEPSDFGIIAGLLAAGVAIGRVARTRRPTI